MKNSWIRSGPLRRWLLPAALSVALMASYSPVPVYAATTPAPSIIVAPPTGNPATDDTLDQNPGDGICADNSGRCTLRAAIMEANADPGLTTIRLPAGTYTLSIPNTAGVPYENAAVTGDLDVTADLTIIGSNGDPDASPNVTIIQAGTTRDTGIDRVLHVNPRGAGAANVTLKALTIRHGNVAGGSENASGGGIEFEPNGNTSSLTLYNVVVQTNKTAGQVNYQGGAGGGLDLYNFGSPNALVTIEKSVISNNETTVSHGGGINAQGVDLTITDSTISNNFAHWTDEGNSHGGGLSASDNTTVTIRRTLFSSNRASIAQGQGGALWADVPVTVESSTFTGNTSGYYGGGAIYFATSTLGLTNVTIVGNTAANSGTGGGLKVGNGTATLVNTIVYGNTAISGAEINGSVTGSNNMVGANGTGGLTHGVNGNQIGVDPKLSTLGNHGGPTQTYALQSDSPALDAGTASGASSLDQRGLARNVDVPDSGNKPGAPDIGAYEAHAYIAAIPDQSGVGSPISVNFTMAAAPGAVVGGSASDGSSVTGGRSGGIGTLTISPRASGDITITARVTDAVGYYVEDQFILTAHLQAQSPTVTGATTTTEDTQLAGIIITPDAADTTVSHFRISSVVGGKLYQSNGTTEIGSNTYITKAQGDAGLKFTPAADFNGTASFTVQAAYNDAGSGLSDPVTASIPVTPVNDNPVAGPDLAPGISEDSTEARIVTDLLANDKPGPATATDEAGQTLSITGAANGIDGRVRFDSTDGAIYFTPAPDFHGNATFTYTLEDSAGATSSGAVTVPVTPIADTPSVTDATTDEDTQSGPDLVISRNPADGAEVTHFLIDQILGGRLYQNDSITEITNNTYITFAQGNAGLRFTPDPGKNSDAGGTFSFIVKAATDDQGTGQSTGYATASITVNEVNSLPVGGADTLDPVPEDSGQSSVLISTLLANDSPGPDDESAQTLSVTGVTPGTGIATTTVSSDGLSVLFTPAANFHGDATFTYMLKDSGATPNTSPVTVTVPVTPVADTPTITNATTAEDVQTQSGLVVSRNGVDSDEVTHFQISGLSGGALYTSTGTLITDKAYITYAETQPRLKFTPPANGNGTYTFTVKAATSDSGAGLSRETTATIIVTPVNDAPVADDEVLSVTVGSNKSARVTATDVDGDTLTYALVDAPTKGTVTFNPDGIYSYQGTSTGTDTFTYKANDGTLDSNVATVTVTISSRPAPPPDLTISVPTTLTRESSILVSGTTRPNLSVVVNGSTVQADGSGNWSATITLVEGENLITASNGFVTRSVTVVRDSIPPQLTLTASPTTTTGTTAVLTAVSEEGALVKIEGQETTRLTVSLALGSNQFTATATDAAGNQATTRVNVVRTPKEVREIELPPGGEGRVETEFVTVTVPPQLFTDGVLLVVQEFEPSEASRLAETAGQAVVFAQVDAYRKSDNRQIHNLGGLMTITFPYDPTAVVDPAKLRIYYFDPDGKVWVELGGVVDAEAHTISVQVSHLTLFAAMVPREAAPILDQLPEVLTDESLTVTGRATPETPVTLMVNGQEQGTVTAGKEGSVRFTAGLAEGPNRIYLKGTGSLASAEASVTYRPFPYSDLGGHWALDAVRRLHRLNVITIYEGESFLPDKRVTRVEFAVMVARVLNLAPEDAATLTFTDKAAMPAELLPEVAAAVKAGIIRGMPDGSFAPNELVTRAQMAVMLTRALTYAGLDDSAGARRFSDQNQIPDWALDGVLAAARHGLITGYPDGSFQPANTTTRAEAVTMLNRLLTAVESK